MQNIDINSSQERAMKEIQPLLNKIEHTLEVSNKPFERGFILNIKNNSFGIFFGVGGYSLDHAKRILSDRLSE